ncbi:general stress protein 13 [Bacillaceae bacterium Marseille-Q3522]|nr:general stress protein 13 [Bacillaceae bacterium Marseille-Q3522]
MSEKFEAGNIITGKITGIQPYGAFVSLDENTQGLVHISEVTDGFVKDIHDHVKIGDEVTVKVLSVDESSGKIGLSIRQALQTSEIKEQKTREKRQMSAKLIETESANGFHILKDKLQEWIEQSKRDNLIRK